MVLVRSEVKNKLFVKNLPRNISKDALLRILEEHVKGEAIGNAAELRSEASDTAAELRSEGARGMKKQLNS